MRKLQATRLDQTNVIYNYFILFIDVHKEEEDEHNEEYGEEEQVSHEVEQEAPKVEAQNAEEQYVEDE